MKYEVDLRDLKFQLFEWLPTEELLAAERFADWDRESVEMAIDEALKLATEELAPINEEGDRTGVKLDAGRVKSPESFRAAYQLFCEGGWVGCSSNPEYGGLGLPQVVGTVVDDLFAGANMTFCLVNVLTRGTAHLVEEFGSDELRAQICERMYTGEWAGTMCLTEAQAGSDVGACTTRAEKQKNGRYRIRGEKIFITSGDHDLTENVIHAVLARTPDAPPGTRGLSLFIVPKIQIRDDGSLGEANDVHCVGLEHKIGIHASPTCSLSFGPNDACEGVILGEEGQGMRLMFQMMNEARLEVGGQATAVAGAAHQAALSYAHERLQMRAWNAKSGEGPAQVPIVEHPDVRRMLFTSSAYVQAMRALLLRTAFYIDQTQVTAGEERGRYQSFVDLLTPICKAWCSDWSFRITEWCLQVFCGYGYTVDYPAEQYLRDVKITSIYEGSNGIQALDFVGRKLPARGGVVVGDLLGMAGQTAVELGDDAELGGPAQLLGEALGQLREILGEVPKRPDGPLVVVLNAVPLLEMFGVAFGAWFLLDQARIAQRRLAEMLAAADIEADDAEARRRFLEGSAEAAFYHNKVQSAVHFAYRALPSVTALGVSIRAGEKAAMEAIF